MKDFKKLSVWEKAHHLTLAAYKVTQTFPSDEKFGIISQIRRSSSSIPTNIAEGCGRQSNADFYRFLHHAMGSAKELEYKILLSKDLSYLHEEQHLELGLAVEEVQKMLTALIKKVELDR